MTVVTLRFSRACVHRPEIVYIAEPSDSRHSTGRSGAATAAPTAAGIPYPMAPPVRVNQSCAGAPAVAAVSGTLEVLDSSTTITCSGINAPITSATDAAVRAPVGSCGRDGAATAAAMPGATSSASGAHAAAAPVCPASTWTLQPSGTRSLGLPG